MNSRLSAYQAAVHAKRDAAYASPPISPEPLLLRQENMTHADEEQSGLDPPLFASPIARVADLPLFPREAMGPVAQKAIAEHMKSHKYASLERKPSRKDYELVVSFQSTVYDSAVKNPRAWWKQERQFDQYYGRPTGVKKQPALKKLAPAPTTTARLRQNKVAIPRAPPSTLPRIPRSHPPKRSPLSQIHDTFDSAAPVSESSPKPAKSLSTRDDTDYTAIPDFSPPLDTLPKGNAKILKAEWKGSVLDLSNDPDRHMLHEAELVLAATLRLTCATYLCSKRRLFIGRIEALKKGKEFRKTDAQQSCKIDVNKASKLWSSYDKVGWFKADYFRQYL